MILRFFCALVLLCSCGGEPYTEAREASLRIASLDVCADQYVLAFTSRAHIAALSPYAEDDFSLMRVGAAGIPTVPPVLEDILLLRPDIVVRSYGGERGITEQLQRAGIKVVQVPFADDLEGVARNIRSIGEALNAPHASAKRAARLSGIPPSTQTNAQRPAALYLTPSGVTTGPGTIIHEVISAAGYANFIDEPGWHDINLERLADQRPDLVITGFLDAKQPFKGQWSVGRHPFLEQALGNVPRVDLPGALLSCNTWALADAVDRVKAFADET